MKYINKLNIDFNQWDELNNNDCIYLIFRSKFHLYLGFIIKKNNNYFIKLLNEKKLFNINVINNIISINNYIYYYKKNILYEDLIKTNFYKENKILIVGINVDKEDIFKIPELYVNDCLNKKFDF